jgi:tetratricopeptide (TPR) repeat protein
MKRAFVITIVFMFALFLLNSLSLAEEAEKKSDEKAKVETKVEVHKIVKESDREIGKEGANEELEDDDGENEDGVVYRELLDMLKRQNEQIQQLREEIKGLRRLIEERLQPQVRRGEGEPQPMNMESDIRMLEEKVKREPNNAEAHMKLGELYSKRGKIDAAINQYEMVTKIRPDFDPPYAALERLRNQGKEREAQPEGEFNMGEVISSNMEYVTIKTFEGNTVAFKVPRVKKDDGSWVSKMDIPEKGARVKIFWNGVEGQKVIKRMEFLEKERREEARQMEEYCMGEVISSNMEEVTIKTLENGETLTFRVPRVKKDDGSWGPPKMDIPEKGARVKISWKMVETQKVITHIEFLEKERREEAKPMKK